MAETNRDQPSPWRRAVALLLHGDAGEAALGRRGERAAARFLRRKRFKVLARNLSMGIGEIDILCRAPDGLTLVIVEVKTRIARQGSALPPPEAAITGHKRTKLVQLARLATQKYGTSRVRIDVVAVDWPGRVPGPIRLVWPKRARPVLRHYEAAVPGG